MRGRRSTAASVILWLILSASWSRDPFCGHVGQRRRAVCLKNHSQTTVGGYDISLLTADTQDQSSKAGWKRSGSLRWKSSSGLIALKVSNYSRADGLSSAHLHGWDGVADWPKTSRKPSLPPKRGSTSQISASSREGSQEPDIVTFIMIQALDTLEP